MGGSGSGRKARPVEGGAVGGGEQDQVRGPIKEMLAGGSEDDFRESLPEQTSSESSGELEPKPKRTYKKRASREEATAAPVDKRLERAQSKMTGLGAAGLISAGFTMSGKPLNDEEDEDVGDQFYLISKKFGGNSDSWIFIIGYTLALLAKLVILRTEAGEEFQKWLKNMFAERNKKNEQLAKEGNQS